MKIWDFLSTLAVGLMNCPGCADVGVPTKDSSGVLSGIIKAILFLAGMIAVGALVASSYQIMTNSTQAPKLAEAKRGVFYAIVGLIVVAAAWGIVQLVMDSASGKGMSLLGGYYG